MTVKGYIIWISLVIIVYGGLQLPQFFVRKKCGVLTRAIVLAVKLLVAFSVAYASIAVNSILTWKAGVLLAALYVALMGDSISDVLTLPYVARKKHLDCQRVQAVASLVCVAIFLLYGTVNMQTVRANSFTVTSEKIKNTYRLAFVADMHVGSPQSFRTTANLIEKIGGESPDAIILGGDITDEYTTKEEMQKTYELFGRLQVPVFFVYGNHDRQPNSVFVGGHTYTEAELEKALMDNGIQVLEDEWIEFSEDLVFFGRDDVSTGMDRIALSEIPERPQGKYVVLVDHSPYSVEDTIESKADFQLSGHTHAGQLFPLQAFYNITGYDAYGFYRHGNTEVYVSSGAAGWMFPFRSEAFCHYEIITLSPGK